MEDRYYAKEAFGRWRILERKPGGMALLVGEAFSQAGADRMVDKLNSKVQ